MIRFQYSNDSTEFVDAAIERFIRAGNISAITRIQQYQDQLEASCLIEARRLLNSDETYPWFFPLPILDLYDLMGFLGLDNKAIRLRVPLYSLAVIAVLFDVMVSPKRNFRSARKIFMETVKQDIELRDELDQPLFNSEIMGKRTAEENSFFRLFDLFIDDHPSLLADSTERELNGFRQSMPRIFFQELFDFAAHEVARPLVKQIKGEADGRSK